MLGEMLADDAELEGAVARGEFAGNPHQLGIAGAAIGRGHLGHPDTIGPLDFEWRRRQEQRPGETALGAEAGFRDRFLAGEKRDALGEFRRRYGVPVHLVDRAGDGGFQTVGRKA